MIPPVPEEKNRAWNEYIQCPFCAGEGRMGKVAAIVLRRLLFKGLGEEKNSEI